MKLSSEDVTLDGEPARRLTYRDENGDARNFVECLMIKGSIMYIAVGSCASAREDASALEGTIGDLLASFECH